ncbi:MAG: reverse transcriptase/maturase family protein [Elusimicrobia bacterium]|nr:reverse transcriptase/maturase family protein [Elusimicrobiota bacterium]
MTTHKGLFERVCSFENLLLAFRKAARGKGHRAGCAEFSYDRERRILAIRERLLAGAYAHGPYRDFMVFDPKLRDVRAAQFPDRVVHHALCNVIEPIFEGSFISDSFACRKGRGTLAALERCRSFARKFAEGYVLKADIAKFFPSVDHAILQGLIARKVADQRVLRLCADILASSQDGRFRAFFTGDDLFALSRPTGIPIGNLTSQLFANVYLNELDRFVKQELRWKAYLRYMDDVLLFGPDKARLRTALSRTEDFLARNLRLRVHPLKRTVSPVRCGVDWVGYRVFPPGARGPASSESVRLRRSNIFRFRDRNRRLRRLWRAGKLPLSKILESIRSFLGYARWAQAGRLMERLLELEAF